jgi:hypothetical protein
MIFRRIRLAGQLFAGLPWPGGSACHCNANRRTYLRLHLGPGCTGTRQRHEKGGSRARKGPHLGAGRCTNRSSSENGDCFQESLAPLPSCGVQGFKFSPFALLRVLHTCPTQPTRMGILASSSLVGAGNGQKHGFARAIEISRSFRDLILADASEMNNTVGFIFISASKQFLFKLLRFQHLNSRQSISSTF